MFIGTYFPYKYAIQSCHNITFVSNLSRSILNLWRLLLSGQKMFVSSNVDGFYLYEKWLLFVFLPDSRKEVERTKNIKAKLSKQKIWSNTQHLRNFIHRPFHFLLLVRHLWKGCESDTNILLEKLELSLIMNLDFSSLICYLSCTLQHVKMVIAFNTIC